MNYSVLYFLVNLLGTDYIANSMKSLSVSELKARFSEVLKRVLQGESFVIVYGRKKTPVAKIVPFEGPKKKKAKDRTP